MIERRSADEKLRLIREQEAGLQIDSLIYHGEESDVYKCALETRAMVLKVCNTAAGMEREVKGLVSCQGIEGIPQLEKTYLDPKTNGVMALLTEYIDVVDLRTFFASATTEEILEFFKKFKKLIKEIHKRKSLLPDDIMKDGNILASGTTPYLVDWGGYCKK